MTFHDWLSDPEGGAQINRWWLAESLGCGIATIYRLGRVGAEPPERKLMMGIYWLTKYRVEPNDWFPEMAAMRERALPTPPPKQRRRRPSARTA